MGICDGRIVVITGAGRGIGREHALEFASQGAKVVVNDLGAEIDGSGSSAGPAGEVVDEIRGMGGEAVANGDDVSDFEGAGRLIQTAIDSFGGLDVLVNNAGILRDRMLVNMTIDEWDAVIRVHLRGTFAPTRHAVEYWRNRSKAGETNDARVINTTSPRDLRECGTDQLRCGQGGDRLLHHDRRHGTRPLRHHGQRHRPGRDDPHDREPRLFDESAAEEARGVRPAGPRQHRPPGGLVRQPRIGRSPGVSSTCSVARSAWPRDGWPAGRPTRTIAGTRPSWARSCRTWWPRRPQRQHGWKRK